MPVGAMQDELDDVCQHLIDKSTDADFALPTFTLKMLLTALRPRFTDDVDETMQYIATRHAQEPAVPHEAILLALFKEIRSMADSVTGAGRKKTIQCTGTIKGSHCMCLYVCGLLHPPGMEFHNLLHDD
jgi:hypothetical protein